VAGIKVLFQEMNAIQGKKICLKKNQEQVFRHLKPRARIFINYYSGRLCHIPL
jgi:hypothetical protein